MQSNPVHLHAPAGVPRPLKVPRITAWFWITKILTTAMGEATSDFLAHRLGPLPAGAIGGVALLVGLGLQFRARRYVPWIYWFAVAMVAVFGTMVADGLHIELKIPYALSTVVLMVVLAAVFTVWYRTEHTLSIHSINSPRREAFYWATVIATFALGTAAGDLTALTLKLGFLTSVILFGLVILVPAVLYRWMHLNSIAAFWFAYVITRPLGASWADWMDFPRTAGGLNFGRGTISIALSIVLVVLIGFLQLSRVDVPRETAGLPS